MEDIEGTNIGVVCRNQDEENAAFKKADAENRPHLFVRRKRKYARVECDMVTCNRVLTDEAITEIEKAQQRFMEIARGNSANNNDVFWFSIGREIITLKELVIPNAKAYAREIEPIVTDPSNHSMI